MQERRFTNHKETWTVFDRDGNTVVSVELPGWDNDVPEEIQLADIDLRREEDGEGQLDWHEDAINHEHSGLRVVKNTITEFRPSNGEPYKIGSTEYRRECDLEEG